MPSRFLRSLAVLLAVLLLTTSSFGQIDTTATIVGWNLKGFGAIPDSRLPNLARVIADLDPEVIALAEVNPDDVVDKLILELSKRGACYQGKVIDQPAIQNLAILYKTGVAVSNVALVDGSDDNNSGLRKALTADVRVGLFDFTIIAVHLKSARGNTEWQTRSRQAAVIATFIQQATAGAEKDVLVVGDYNMIPGDDDVNFTAMNPTAFLQFISSEDWAGQFSHIGSGGQQGNLLDGYAISANAHAGVHRKELANHPCRSGHGADTSGVRRASFGSPTRDCQIPDISGRRLTSLVLSLTKEASTCGKKSTGTLKRAEHIS